MMESSYFAFALSVFTGFFAIMNPIANTPVFLGLVEDSPQAQREKIARTACITAFVIVTAFVVLGNVLFSVFGITIPAFKITGGLLLFYVGFEMLQSKKSNVHHQGEHAEVDDGVAISPLAIPILAGPGTIVTAMSHVTSTNLINNAIVIGMFAIMCFLSYLSFRMSNIIVRKLGQNLIIVIGKIMGLVIAIMGTGMVIDGIKLGFLK